MGIECSLLEIQKLAWFLQRAIEQYSPDNNPLNLDFQPHKYGPYTHQLNHLLDVILFVNKRKDDLQAYLKSEAKPYRQALESAALLIDGFESPFGMELLATVDWLLTRENIEPNVPALRKGLRSWRGGEDAALRKDRIFNDRSLGIALDLLTKISTLAIA